KVRVNKTQNHLFEKQPSKDRLKNTPILSSLIFRDSQVSKRNKTIKPVVDPLNQTTKKRSKIGLGMFQSIMEIMKPFGA
ncbi:unnamed protein product, partial [Brassica oleracea]